ncbi:hypothetical protein QQF64_019395 [Cirrhinus molitorella]|uniref:Vitellogenin n=1 Tax=Cirrhinus molitorella TaxID=172907 RepID=A0ABR3LFC5_9TELE
MERIYKTYSLDRERRGLKYTAVSKNILEGRASYGVPLSQRYNENQEKYPDVVSLPEGCRSELMIIRSPQLPGISMTIFWKIDVSMEGVIKPRLELLLKIPDQAREFDTKKVTENGSEYFQSLLRILGVEASIEGLIRTETSPNEYITLKKKNIKSLRQQP